MKFKIGDKVQVKMNPGQGWWTQKAGGYNGEIGIVARVNPGCTFPYHVGFPDGKEFPYMDEELILVKGVTPEILYGNDQKPGLVDFLTVQAKSNKINLNAASKSVLMALPGMTPEIAEAVAAYRQDKEIQSLQEIAGLLGEAQAQLAPYVTVTAGNTFTIESRGYKKNSQAGYGIQAKIALEGNNRYRYLSYKNPVIIKTEKGTSE